MDFQQETTMSFVIKNTFLELEDREADKGRSGKYRSSSVPRSWRSPCCSAGQKNAKWPSPSNKSDLSDDTTSTTEGESCSEQDSPESARMASPKSFQSPTSPAQSAGRGEVEDDDNEDAKSFASCCSDFGEPAAPILGEEEDDLLEYKGLPAEPLPMQGTTPLSGDDGDEEPCGIRTPATMPWADTPSRPSSPEPSFWQLSPPPLPTFQALPPTAYATDSGDGDDEDCEERERAMKLAAVAASIHTKLSGWHAEPEDAVTVTVTPTELAETSPPEEENSVAATMKTLRRKLPQLPPVASDASKRLNALDLCVAAPVKSTAGADPKMAPARMLLAEKAEKMAEAARKLAEEKKAKAAAAAAKEQQQLAATVQEQNQQPEMASLQAPLGFVPIANQRSAWADTVDMEEMAAMETTHYGLEYNCMSKEEPVVAKAEKKVALNLCLCLPEEEQAPAVPPPRVPLTKLKTVSKPFTPVLSLLQEASAVVAAARQAILQSPQVLWAEVQEGTLGSTTTISAQVAKGPCPIENEALQATALAAAKSAFLDAASASSCCYVMGYLVEPFKDLDPENSNFEAGFVLKLGFVPASAEETACWDTFEKGFCRRHSTCRWCHPQDTDVLHVVVQLM
jgi:hypothetical protein